MPGRGAVAVDRSAPPSRCRRSSPAPAAAPSPPRRRPRPAPPPRWSRRHGRRRRPARRRSPRPCRPAGRATTTRAPRSASGREVASPRPDAPPVTMAEMPLMSMARTLPSAASGRSALSAEHLRRDGHAPAAAARRQHPHDVAGLQLDRALVRQALGPAPRRRRAAASSPPPPRARRRPGPTVGDTRRSVISDTVASARAPARSRSMPSPPGARARPAAPPPQAVAQHPHREAPARAPRPACSSCWSSRCGRRSCPGPGDPGGRPGRRRRSRSTPRPDRRCPASGAADEQVVHRPLRRGADPLGQRLGQRAEAHVGDPLADLDVAGADRGRRPGVDDRARGGDHRHRPHGAAVGRDASDRWPPAARTRPRLTVTASTAFTLPSRCGRSR